MSRRERSSDRYSFKRAFKKAVKADSDYPKRKKRISQIHHIVNKSTACRYRLNQNAIKSRDNACCLSPEEHEWVHMNWDLADEIWFAEAMLGVRFPDDFEVVGENPYTRNNKKRR